MNRRLSLAFVVSAVLAGGVASTCYLVDTAAHAQATAPAATGGAASPFANFTRPWRDDPIWHDGKAEIATYDATRTIYGQPRQYEARFMTNKELADPVTKTKAADNDPRKNREAFKHHVREAIPTENYTYHFSTMCYVGTSDLKSLKIDMGSQEDCGATFKQYVNHMGNLEWHQFSYFPGEGHKSGGYKPPADFAYQDALSLVLRGYPFEDPSTEPLEIALLPDQTTTKLSPAEPAPARVAYVGRESLDLPIGKVDAHHLRVTANSAGGEQPMDYWFAADPALLHVMVRYEGPEGITYELRSMERRAYWER